MIDGISSPGIHNLFRDRDNYAAECTILWNVLFVSL